MLQLETMTHSVARKQFVKASVGVAQEGTSGLSKETLYECNRRYETMYYIYVGLQHVKCELARRCQKFKAPSRSQSLFLSFPRSMLLDLTLIAWQQLVVAPACRASDTTCIVSFRLFSNREKIREDKRTALATVQGRSCRILWLPSPLRRKAARRYPYGGSANLFGRTRKGT